MSRVTVYRSQATGHRSVSKVKRKVSYSQTLSGTNLELFFLWSYLHFILYILCIVEMIIAFSEPNRDAPHKGLELPRTHCNFYYFTYRICKTEK